MPKITELQVNGNTLRVEADAERSLLSVLRDDLELTGAKYGCGEGQCGACTVLIDDTPTHPCLTQVGQVGRKKNHHHRRRRAEWSAASVAGCVSRNRRDAM